MQLLRVLERIAQPAGLFLGGLFLAVLAIGPDEGYGQATHVGQNETPSSSRAPPDLSGVWVSTLTSFDDPRWTIEDQICGDCTVQSLERLRALLDDPKSSNRPLNQLGEEIKAFNGKFIADLLTESAKAFQKTYDQKDDPVLACKPVGLFSQADAILPMQIEQYEGRVVFRYEYFNSVRTVYTDGRGHPPNLKPSRLGHSIGWWDGNTLVVDTVGLEPHIVGAITVDGMRTSEHARGIERYTRSKDDNVLSRETVIVDPKTFRRPLIFANNFLHAPKEKLQEFECEVRSGVTED